MNKLILVGVFALSAVLLVKGDRYGNDIDDDGNYGDKVDRIDNDQDNAEVNVRSKRGIRGTYRETSNKKSKSYRQVFKHRTQTGPEGRVSVDTQHHHERAGAQEQSNKAGSFGFANTGDNGWFDNGDDHLIHY